MAKVTVFNMNGQEVGDIELNDAIFNIDVNKAVLHQVVVGHLANRRQGTQSAKTRSEVRGGGAKPYKQKGTGRARQGSIRAPQWTGGGVVFAPKPRDYSKKVNRKTKRLALKSALSAKVQDKKFVVLDELQLDEIKTKKMQEVVENLKLGKALIVLNDTNKNVVLSARNIPQIQTTLVSTMNVYDILKYDTFVITKAAVATIEEVYA